MATPERSNSGLGRRSFLAIGGAAGIGLAAGRLSAPASEDEVSSPEAAPFHGRHQPGIATQPLQHLQLAAFDVTTASRDDLQELARLWSRAASQLSKGVGLAGARPTSAPPLDPGEVRPDHGHHLTLTFGLGPGIFDRVGLLPDRPPALAPLPEFRGEALEERWSGGDLCVQACADDPQVAFHAVHLLSRLADGAAVPRWTQAGFRGPMAPGRPGVHLNLMGFHEGTGNLDAGDPAAMGRHVWAGMGSGEPSWMQHGTYMVVRRIRMLLDVWDLTSLGGQERAIGKRKSSGRPLQTMPHDAHVRLAAPEANAGARLLRRSYSYVDGVDEHGQLDAGLVFISYQRDPHRQFVPIQQRLAESDALNKHLLHTGSALFACPPGTTREGMLGEGLFRA